MLNKPRHCLITHEEPGSDRPRRRLTGQTGFSLIELLVVMALLLVVMGAIYGVWLGLARTYAFTDEDMAAQTQSRAAMMEMVEYIRTARQPLSAAVQSYDLAIPAAGPLSLTLWTDIDRDGSHTLHLIRYSVSPDPLDSTKSELVRQEGNASTCSFAGTVPVRVVTFDVVNDSAHPLFTYLDGLGENLDRLGEGVTNPAQIRQILVSLRIDANPGRSPAVNVLTSAVQPRNLRQ